MKLNQILNQSACALSVLLIGAVVAMGSIQSAQATTVIPPSFDELVSKAELIFEGTVKNVQSRWEGEGAMRHIQTYVTFNVHDVMKGQAQKEYTISMLGGTVDNQTMEVTDVPKFKVGNRDILFIQNNGSQFVPLVGIMHGRVKVVADPNQNNAEVVATDENVELTDIKDIGGMIAHGQKALRKEEFKALVRANKGINEAPTGKLAN